MKSWILFCLAVFTVENVFAQFEDLKVSCGGKDYIIGKRLGEGHFGIVYTLESLDENKEDQALVIKVYKQSDPTSTIEEEEVLHKTLRDLGLSKIQILDCHSDEKELSGKVLRAKTRIFGKDLTSEDIWENERIRTAYVLFVNTLVENRISLGAFRSDNVLVSDNGKAGVEIEMVDGRIIKDSESFRTYLNFIGLNWRSEYRFIIDILAEKDPTFLEKILGRYHMLDYRQYNFDFCKDGYKIRLDPGYAMFYIHENGHGYSIGSKKDKIDGYLKHVSYSVRGVFDYFVLYIDDEYNITKIDYML